MEKELIDKLFGPPINQVLVPQSNLNLTTVNTSEKVINDWRNWKF